MNYPLSYWKKGDLVVLHLGPHWPSSPPRLTPLYNIRNHLFMYIRPYDAGVAIDVAVLYCINNGTFVRMHASYIREPKQ